MLYDLTGKKVSFTYGRLVQIASGSYYDGFGNLLDLPGPSGSYLTTGSNYPITSSWSINSVSASYAPCNCPIMHTGSTYPITSSWALNTLTSSYVQISQVSSPIKTITTSYNVLNDDYTILCDASSGTINLKLQAASSTNKRLFNIKKIDTTGHLINVTTTNADLIDFDVTQSIAFKGTNMCVQSNGVQYWIL